MHRKRFFLRPEILGEQVYLPVFFILPYEEFVIFNIFLLFFEIKTGMKKTLLQCILLILLTVSGFAQKNNFWSINNESRNKIIADKSVFRQSYPPEQKLFNLNFQSFKQELFSIVGKKPLKASTIITLPNAAGNIEEFELVEASNFEPALQARFPELRAYSGKGITDRSATVKLSISPQGIQTMVFRTEKDNEFIEPY
jgi:hypothetical protein